MKSVIHEICDTASIFDDIFPLTIFESHLKHVSTIGDQSAALPFGYPSIFKKKVLKIVNFSLRNAHT